MNAICFMKNPKQDIDNGCVVFTQYADRTVVSLDLYNLPPGKHGFHVHASGDMTKGCDSMGPHYNPFGHTHGDINQLHNHLGDLGNITANECGVCRDEIIVDYLPLYGVYGIVGRGLVIHEKPDDLGIGPEPESKKTGNSGARISCGVIRRM